MLLTFRPRFKPAFTASQLAVIPDDDNGLLPLRIASPVARRDSRIKGELEESPEARAALLVLAVAGARDWLRDGADLDPLRAAGEGNLCRPQARSQDVFGTPGTP